MQVFLRIGITARGRFDISPPKGTREAVAQINTDEQRCPKGFPSVTRGLGGQLRASSYSHERYACGIPLGTAPRTDDLLARTKIKLMDVFICYTRRCIF